MPLVLCQSRIQRHRGISAGSASPRGFQTCPASVCRDNRYRGPRVAAIILAIAACIWIAPARADVITCVPPGDSQAFQNALTTAASNDEADEIRLPAGTYVALGAGFEYFSVEPHGLSVSGRWNATCTGTRGMGPTTLDGLYSRSVLEVSAYVGASVTVTRLRFFRGDGLLLPASGLTMYADPGDNGEILIALNEFIANGADNTAAAVGGLYMYLESGEARVSNNLFVGNRGVNAGGAIISGLDQEAPFVPMTSNTFVYNVGGGLNFGGGVVPVISNSVLWANEGFDLAVFDNARVFYNDIGVMIGDPGENVGNISVDPGFVGADNFRLTPASPLVNAGREDVSYGLTSVDLDGRTRVQGGFVDIGAYELPESIFVDDFD